MKQDVKFEKVTKDIIFVCDECHCRIRGGENIHLRFNLHDDKCGSRSFKYTMPGDKYYNFIRTYSGN